MKKLIIIMLLISCSVLISSVVFSEDKLTPVKAWKNGFTAEQSDKFVTGFKSSSFVTSDDYGAYFVSNLSEFLFTSSVYRGGNIGKLEVELNESIGKFKVDGPLGNLTLEEVIADERSRMQGIIVLQKGKIVYEKYPGMPANSYHLWMSSSKVITGLLIHMLDQEGRLSLNDDVTKYIPEYKGTGWEGVKLVDILHQQSGMDLIENAKNIGNPKSPISRAYAFSLGPKGSTPDASAFEIMKDAKPYMEPGKQFDYTSFNTQILGTVIEKITNKKFADVFTEKVWSLAGMEGDGVMANSPVGESLNSGFFASRLRDKARFALLFTPSYTKVTKTRIVDEDYFKNVYGSNNSSAFFNKGSDMGPRMIKDFKETPSHTSYQWDAVFSDGDLYKSGKNGQCIYVSPKKDMAVVWFSSVYHNSVWLPIYARAIVKHLSD